MKTFRIPLIHILQPLAILLLSSNLVSAQQDAASILRRSSEANDRDWAAAPEFDNYERDHNKDGDKTYSVTMLYGSPYERLIAENGKTLDPSRQQEEQKKYENAEIGRAHV